VLALGWGGGGGEGGGERVWGVDRPQEIGSMHQGTGNSSGLFKGGKKEHNTSMYTRKKECGR